MIEMQARTAGEPEMAETSPLHGGPSQRKGRRSSTRLSIRPATPSDRERLRGMFSRCTSQTVYRRFHIPFREVPERMLDLMLDVDHEDREFLVAVSGGEIVGHAMYVRLGGGSEAEMAIVVEDAWQSRGLGRALITDLAESAMLRGIETFTAEVLGGNRRMLGLAAASFAGAEYRIRHGLYHVRMPLRVPGPEAPAAQTLRPAA